jgi:hypothetical protein
MAEKMLPTAKKFPKAAGNLLTLREAPRRGGTMPSPGGNAAMNGEKISSHSAVTAGNSEKFTTNRKEIPENSKILPCMAAIPDC